MKKIFFVLFFLFAPSFVLDTVRCAPAPSTGEVPAETESTQKMLDFSLAGYTQKGKKSWEVKGNSADIFNDIVKLTTINANVYGEEENINLTADKGTYNKADGKMHLEENVVVNTQTGGKLTTDSLDWDRVTQKVTTPDIVNIAKENLTAVAKGLEGQPNLNQVFLQKDVHVEIKGKEPASDAAPKDPSSGAESGMLAFGDSKKPTVITCDGPLEIDYTKQTATFKNNVKVEQEQESQMYADKMEVDFDFKNKALTRIKSIGNVKIVKGDNTSYSEEALYTASDKKMTLTGRPRLVIYSEGNLINAPTGN